MAWAGIAAAILVTVISVAWYATTPRSETFTTGIGEQRSLVLEDGSVVDMNTLSKVSVLLTRETRNIELHSGEALFKVAKDSTRPFVVQSGHATVKALGTQFNVYQLPDEVRITVVEGRVTVANLDVSASPEGRSLTEGASAISIELDAGDAADVRPGKPIRKSQQVNTARTLAWTDRRLIFDNEPLAAVVAEFNRYNTRQLSVIDGAIAGQRISAVFDADRPETLVRFLTQSPQIEAVEASPSLILIQAASSEDSSFP
jgi:transmembrane sensor